MNELQGTCSFDSSSIEYISSIITGNGSVVPDGQMGPPTTRFDGLVKKFRLREPGIRWNFIPEASILYGC